MLNDTSDLHKRRVELTPKAINVYFLEGESYPVALELPSAKELDELRNTYSSKISIRKMELDDPINLREIYKNELNKFLKKKERFSTSSKYFVRLANLSSLAGDSNLAIGFLNEAEKLGGTKEIKHYLGNTYISIRDTERANEIFRDCDLENDVYANLRIAYINVLSNDYEGAKLHVENALRIDELNSNAQMFYGTLCLKNLNFEKAIRSFRVAYLEKPKSSPLLVNMAVAYWYLDLRKQAMGCLRKAVNLDPLNENAVSFFADVMHLERLDDKTIPVLKKYLQFEQYSENVWGQLGRAHFCQGKRETGTRKILHLDAALDSLRHQENLKSTSMVWNNMGVIAAERRDLDQARRYFGFAIQKANEEDHNQILLPIFNLCHLYIESKKFNESYSLIKTIVSAKHNENFQTALYERIKLQFIISLDGMGKASEATQALMHFLGEGLKDKNVHLDMLIRATYHYVVIDHDTDRLMGYINQMITFIESNAGLDENLKRRAFNNIAFAYLEEGRGSEAEKFLQWITQDIHKDAFATATLGMSKIRKGQVEEGEKLYREALGMIRDEKHKSYFRQRMFYEIGRAYILEGNLRKGSNYLEKAKREKDGFPYIKSLVGDALGAAKRLTLQIKT